MLKKIILLLCCCLPYLSRAQQREVMDTSILVYSNYFNKLEYVPLGEISMTKIIKDSVFKAGEIKHDNEVKDRLLEILIRQDIINEWSIVRQLPKESPLFPGSYEDFIDSLRKALLIYCLGRIEYGKEFSTFLLQINEDKFGYFFYLLNIRNNIIKSIVRIADGVNYKEAMYRMHDFTILLPNKKFLYKHYQIGDVLMDTDSEMMAKGIHRGDEILFTKFYFDKSGYLRFD